VSSFYNPKAILDINHDDLKKLEKCKIYSIGELLAKKTKDYIYITPTVSGFGISIPKPVWKEEKIMVYAHKKEKDKKVLIEIFSLPKKTIITFPLKTN